MESINDGNGTQWKHTRSVKEWLEKNRRPQSGSPILLIRSMIKDRSDQITNSHKSQSFIWKRAFDSHFYIS